MLGIGGAESKQGVERKFLKYPRTFKIKKRVSLSHNGWIKIKGRGCKISLEDLPRSESENYFILDES